MYRNEIREEMNEDVKGERALLLEKFWTIERQFLLEYRPYEIAHCIVLWFKYYRSEIMNYELFIFDKSIPFDYSLTLKETEYLENVIEMILKERYKLKIISKNPFILESKIPFHEINEEVVFELPNTKLY